ncbi:unnamed protein product [Rotaria sordida]|uniref:Uncharacterized protein n=1 Tax=Rotaria sordida TaxID=392033 RepID=A0A814C6X8_9BILA|nr:unnamed protein product [Rotaria sordida]
MNLSKRFKKDNGNRDNDDDDIIIIESRTTSSIINEFCQHIDKITGEHCKEYYSVICIHCNLYLCYIHVEIHRILLINERDRLINELNERIDELNQLIENPDKIKQILIEQIEIKYKKKISFIQQLSIEKLMNLNKIIIELKQLFQPIRIIFQQNQCVSLIQIKKIQEFEWKNNLDGKILDIHYSFYLKLFFILTDEKLFSFNRLSSFICLHRFTSLPWSCTTLLNSIYILYKYSTIIEQWTFQETSPSIQLIKQWKLNEIISECEHDQHLRCIRANPCQNQLAILIEDDECRWRIALFDHNMNYLHQTNMLMNASTIDWNLIFSFISDQQLIIMDATTENIYLITIDQNTSSTECKQFSNSECPVNACVITSNGYSQLILKVVKPNMLKFFQI